MNINVSKENNMCFIQDTQRWIYWIKGLNKNLKARARKNIEDK